MEPFHAALARHGLTLSRATTHILQVNVGRICNLTCRHCHVEAGPGRPEIMSRQTMVEVVDFADRAGVTAADITGGAPELVPDIEFLLEGLAARLEQVQLRSNLVALLDDSHSSLLDLCRRLGIAIVASFPSLNEKQADAQRGRGVWEKSVAMLRRLNDLGYGMDGTGLDLHLVSNPAGAFLPAGQCAAEKRFRRELARRWGISFTSLLTFANVPLGRFRRWLEKSGNLDSYLEKLASSFNPATVDGLMCRTLISVGWDGCLYDCDFNLAAGLPLSGSPVHVRDLPAPVVGMPIMTDDYCYACTAGSGFT